MNTICPKECKRRINNNANIEVIDIRETFEYEFSNIGCKNIPMQTLLDNVNDLNNDKTYVLMCKTGQRAEALANLLKCEKGFSNILVMTDGITGWQQKNDPSLILE